MDNYNRNRLKGKKTEKNETDMVLRKHVGLIHCENKLSLMQRKIGNILLFNALDQLIAGETHEIPLRKLCSLVGFKSNDSKLIKESVKALITCVMEWNLLEDSKFPGPEAGRPKTSITWNASSLLAGAAIKEGMIYYSYSPQMRSILSSLEIYGRINLFVQAKFNSAYSLVLYENCVRFKNIQQTAWLSLDLFRSLMGVPESKYRSFKELKRNVINVAVNEINQKADIYIEPQFKRSGRSITAVQFLIRENEHYRPSFKRTPHSLVTLPLSQQAYLYEALVAEFGLSKQQAETVVQGYKGEYVLEKIRLVRAKKNVGHAGAYLLAALKQDYQQQRAHTQSIRKTPYSPLGTTGEDDPSLAASYQRETAAASEIQSLRNKYMAYKLRKYVGFIQQQPAFRQALVNEQFEHYIQSNAVVWRFYKKSGLSSPFVMVELMAFVEKRFPEVIGEYMDFDDYITSDEGTD